MAFAECQKVLGSSFERLDALRQRATSERKNPVTDNNSGRTPISFLKRLRNSRRKLNSEAQEVLFNRV
jgi:hypothetical protein